MSKTWRYWIFFCKFKICEKSYMFPKRCSTNNHLSAVLALFLEECRKLLCNSIKTTVSILTVQFHPHFLNDLNTVWIHRVVTDKFKLNIIFALDIIVWQAEVTFYENKYLSYLYIYIYQKSMIFYMSWNGKIWKEISAKIEKLSKNDRLSEQQLQAKIIYMKEDNYL